MGRRIIYTLFLFMLLGYIPVEAQSHILGLSDADYALLSHADGTAVHDFSFEFNTQLAVDGLDTFALKTDLSGSGAVNVATPALDLLVKGTITPGTTQNMPINAQIGWLDDMLYLDLGNGWQAIKPASTFLAQAISQYVGLSADEKAMKTWDANGIEGLGDVLTALTKIEPQTFLTAKRLDDEAVDDVKTAHFQLTADVQALMQTDAFVDVVAAFASPQGNDLVILDHAKLADAVRANSALFKGTTLTVDQYVGLDDQLVHRLVVKLDTPIDPTVGGYSDAPFKITWALDMTMSAINQAKEVSPPDAPEGAKIVSAYAFATPEPLQAATSDVTQYVFFETVGESESYSQSFEAKAGDSVTVTVRGLGLEFDSSAKLLATDGKTLAEDDDHETNAFGVNGPDPQIADYKITKDGTYQTEVQEINGAAGSFVLTITVRR